MTFTYMKLPIDEITSKFKTKLQDEQNVILKASPGSGKTTRLPVSVIDDFNGEILVLEPRRVAARLAAYRVAEEIGEEVGQRVGYHFRFEKKISAQTKLKFLTEGLLIRYLMSNPTLKGVSVVFLDEFHERHLQTDVAISLLRHLQLTKRPDLKIVVMSATLDLPSLEQFLDVKESFVLDIERFPLDIKYLSKPPSEDPIANLMSVVPAALKKPGDILVFLPGVREINRAYERLQSFKECQVLKLYGDMPVAEQVGVLTPNGGFRRVILSTNIAESSVTIPGIRQVIDTGLVRQTRYNHWSGNLILETKKISKSSAIQRAGRAARQAAGICWRLYTESDYNARLEFDKPEIERANLLDTALEISSLGYNVTQNFPWFESPGETEWRKKVKLLEELGAVKNGGITACGRWMAEMPIGSRYARVMYEADEIDLYQECAHLVAYLNEDNEGVVFGPEILDRKLSRLGEKVIQQIIERKPTEAKNQKHKKSIELCLLSGFFDKVAKLKSMSDKSVELLTFDGSSIEARREDSFWEKSKYYIVLDAREQKETTLHKAIASCVWPVHEEILLGSDHLRAEDSFNWNEKSKKIEKISGIYYGAFSLMESQEKIGSEDYPAAFEKLLEVLVLKDYRSLRREEVLNRLSHYFNIEELKHTLARIEFFEMQSNIKIFGSDGVLKKDWLPSFLEGILKLSDEINWQEKWQEGMSWETREKISREIQAIAPDFVSLGKRRAKINYEFDKSPWIESRIQDFFGHSKGPRIGRQGVALTLHLLAPNNRAVQVTEDLEGFWKNHYPKLRIELKRRYPKHLWPENPLAKGSAI